MRACFLQAPRPLNVGGFIKAGAQLDDRGHLFAGSGRVHQSLYDRRIAAGAIQSNLDRKHLWVLGGVLDEFYDRIEAFVGMMQKNILFAQHLEDVGVRGQGRIACGLKNAIL